VFSNTRPLFEKERWYWSKSGYPKSSAIPQDQRSHVLDPWPFLILLWFLLEIVILSDVWSDTFATFIYVCHLNLSLVKKWNVYNFFFGAYLLLGPGSSVVTLSCYLSYFTLCLYLSHLHLFIFNLHFLSPNSPNQWDVVLLAAGDPNSLCLLAICSNKIFSFA